MSAIPLHPFSDVVYLCQVGTCHHPLLIPDSAAVRALEHLPLIDCRDGDRSCCTVAAPKCLIFSLAERLNVRIDVLLPDFVFDVALGGVREDFNGIEIGYRTEVERRRKAYGIPIAVRRFAIQESTDGIVPTGAFNVDLVCFSVVLKQFRLDSRQCVLQNLIVYLGFVQGGSVEMDFCQFDREQSLCTRDYVALEIKVDVLRAASVVRLSAEPQSLLISSRVRRPPVGSSPTRKEDT